MDEHVWIAGRRRDVIAAMVTVLIAAVAGYSGWQAARVERDLRAVVACQSAVNADLRRAAVAVRQSDTQQLAAQLELLTTPPGDRAAALAARDKFVLQLRQALASREANPLPTRDC